MVMQTYINQLPEEIINHIYKIVYNSCLNEIKSIVTCCMCEKIIYSENLDKESYSKCKNCNKEICFNCWNTYCTNYGRGWKPYIRHCSHCVINKMSTIGFNGAIYPN